MGIAKVTRNYQITIPSDIRELQSIQVGDKILFAIEDGRVELIKMRKDVLNRAFGIWGKGDEGIKYTQRLRKEWDVRARRVNS